METYLKIRAILEKNCADAEREIKFYNEVRRMLVEKFSGKRVDTKRTLNYIRSIHLTWTVTWHCIGSSQYIMVWGGDSGFKDYNDAGRVCINRCRDIGYFDTVELDRDNPAIPSTIKAQANRLSLLGGEGSYAYRLERLATQIDSFNAQHKQLTEKLEAMGIDQYDIKSLTKL